MTEILWNSSEFPLDMTELLEARGLPDAARESGGVPLEERSVVGGADQEVFTGRAGPEVR